MSLPLPNLDDRSWQELVDIALTSIHADKDWTDRHPADPGVTLIEVFAYLTKNLQYRMNRIPERLQIALLNLVGIERRPASAAVAELTFKWEGDGDPPELQPGLVIRNPDGSIRFTLAETVRFPSATGQAERQAEGKAVHAVWTAETVGQTNTDPYQNFTLSTPVIGPSGYGDDIIVGIEIRPDDERAAPSEVRIDAGKYYRLYKVTGPEVPAESDAPLIVQVDRDERLVKLISGTEKNAIPPWRAVRAWYRRGGGAAGNVPAGALSLIDREASGIDLPKGLSVSQGKAAMGGADSESLTEASNRTPFASAAIAAAITPRDYERLARSVSGVFDAAAGAPAQRWAHAERGTVRVDIAPVIDGVEARTRIDAAMVRERRSSVLLERVAAAIEAHRPLGIGLDLGWLQVREIEVSLRVVAASGTDLQTLQTSVQGKLNQLFAPQNLMAKRRELRAFDVYETVLGEAGIRYADGLAFRIGEAPAQAAADLVADPNQSATWYVAAAGGLYRTINDGNSWCLVFRTEQRAPLFVRMAQERPGLLALAVQNGDDVCLHVSRDAGENWAETARFDFAVYDVCLVDRFGEDLFLIATAKGLYELQASQAPAPVAAAKEIEGNGCYAIAFWKSRSGTSNVYVAARGRGGIFRSSRAGASGSFTPAGLDEVDVRKLLIEERDGRCFLWAPAGSEAGEPGKGAFRLELRGTGEPDASGWVALTNGWQGGSCEGLAFAGRYVFAGSNRSGILTLDHSEDPPRWQEGGIDSGLPHRSRERLFEPVLALGIRSGKQAGSPAAPPDGQPAVLLAAGPAGVYRSLGEGRFENASQTVFADRAPLPPGWLYCSGEHQVKLTVEGEGNPS